MNPGARFAEPDRTAARTAPATPAARTGPATPPVIADPVITPVAAVGQALAAGAQPFAEPKTLDELGEAFSTLRGGLTDKAGRPFDLFDMGDVPASAVVEKLEPAPGIGFGIQAMPETTQGQADKEAYKWASDAKEIYVGWGYGGRWSPLAYFGQSRHVYYSVQKSRLLYIDYSFFRFTKARWESDDIILKFAGKYITWILSEPRGRFPYNGREAFWEATKYGYVYQNRPRATIKAICISPLIVGPKWVFFDAIDRPTMIVDAADGEVRWNGILLDILRLLFTFNP